MKKYYFNCDSNSSSCCRTTGIHNPLTMKEYHAYNKTCIVYLCDNHYKNHKSYGWTNLQPVENNSNDFKIEKNNSSQSIDGYSCKKCNAYCQFAEPNQVDGISFICYSCRK